MIKDGFQLQSKAAFSHEAYSKNPSRKPTSFCYFIFFKILKIELSPTRERNCGCGETSIGRIFWVTKISEFAVLPACQPSFEDAHAFQKKNYYFAML